MLILVTKNGSGFAVQQVSPLLTRLLKKYHFTSAESRVNGYGGAMLGAFSFALLAPWRETKDTAGSLLTANCSQ